MIVEAGKKVPAGRKALVKMPFRSALAHYANLLGGKEPMMELARLSRDSQMQGVMALWDQIGDGRRSRLRIEGLLDQVGMQVEDFLAELVRAGHVHGVHTAGLILAGGLKDIAKRAVAEAKKPGKDGFQDRRMIFQGAGLTPVPKNTFVAFRQRNTQINIAQPPQAPGLPSIEEENLAELAVGHK